jgi:hypothetical protein
MNIVITFSGKLPRITIDGRHYKPAAAAPDGRLAADHLREALYSGHIPPGSWAVAEVLLRPSMLRAAGAVGGSARGPVKRRGNSAYYAWVVACREAARKGQPKPAKPPVSRAS